MLDLEALGKQLDLVTAHQAAKADDELRFVQRAFNQLEECLSSLPQKERQQYQAVLARKLAGVLVEIHAHAVINSTKQCALRKMHERMVSDNVCDDIMDCARQMAVQNVHTLTALYRPH